MFVRMFTILCNQFSTSLSSCPFSYYFRQCFFLLTVGLVEVTTSRKTLYFYLCISVTWRLLLRKNILNKERCMLLYSWVYIMFRVARSRNKGVNKQISIRSSHKFVPTFVYTFHVSIYKHTAIRDQCTWKMGRSCTTRGGLHFFMKLKGM